MGLIVDGSRDCRHEFTVTIGLQDLEEIALHHCQLRLLLLAHLSRGMTVILGWRSDLL